LFGEANSFRHAEQLGHALLAETPNFSAGQIIAILGLAALNNQIWDAARIPIILDSIFKQTTRHLPYTANAWGRLIKFVISQDRRKEFVDLATKLDDYLMAAQPSN